MVKKKMAPKWNTVRIREEMYREIERVLEREDIKKLGISSISQFVTNALISQLIELRRGSMIYVNIYDDHVKILDSRLEEKGRILAVYFKREGLPYCDYCRATDCVHVQFAWELPKAKVVLEREGLKPPMSRV